MSHPDVCDAEERKRQDGASPNCCFLQLHGPTPEPGSVLYKVNIPDTRERQDTYILLRSTTLDEDSEELLVI